MRRVTAGIVGFLVSPMISALIASATTRLFKPSDIVPRIGMVPVFYYFSAMAAGLLGLPIFLVLFHFKLIRWWSAVGAGLAIGALMGVIVESPRIQLLGILFMASTGAVSALGFWLIWRQGRDAAEIGKLRSQPRRQHGKNK